MKKKISPVLVFAGIVNLLLFTVKLYIGVRTNSLCIYTDSINNLTDTLSLCLATAGIYLMSRPKSERFPFGFGRMEAVTAFVMSIIMTVAGFSFAYSSLTRLMTPVPVWYFTKYAVIIGCTAVVKLILGLIFTVRYKKERSPVLRTVMLDSYLDFGITAMTLVSFTLSEKTGLVLDGALGLVISMTIAITGVKLIVSSVSSLIGERDDDTEAQVREIINSIDNTIEIKCIFIHSYGDEKHISLVLSADDKNAYSSAHKEIKEQLSLRLDCRSTVEWECS